MSETVQNLAETYAMFGVLPDAAREQIGVELGIIGRDLLALQQVRVPKDTGSLEAGLSVAVYLDSLRVRVGLLGLKRGRSNLFYGLIVETGRRAQTVLVQRRRRVNGKLRSARGRKRSEDIATTYPMKVKARAAQPFVGVSDPDIDRVVAQRLADFWAKTFEHAGA